MSISENPIIGSGEFVYECHHNWDRQGLPLGYEYSNASHGIVFDSQGLIYISHNGNPGSLFVFDGDGRFVKAMADIRAAVCILTTLDLTLKATSMWPNGCALVASQNWSANSLPRPRAEPGDERKRARKKISNFSQCRLIRFTRDFLDKSWHRVAW